MAGASAGELEVKICEPGGHGLLFPLTEAEQHWSTGLRAALYVMALLYLFLGVNIVSDKFVAAIEVITSQKKRIRSRTTGRFVTVAVWNGTVANLTLMALGSSAPEILLSVVETMANGFQSGDLGPSTIVGSAAFNLFVIVAVCIMAIPSPEKRQIKETGVFFVTAAFSLFAYAWLVVICSLISPDVVEVWEGVVTLLFLPVFVFMSYLADIGYFSNGRALPTTKVQLPPSIENDPFSFGGPSPRASGRGSSAAALASQVDDAARRAGVFCFPAEIWEVAGGLEEREILVPVLRKLGLEGAVSCKYRMEGRSAVPGYDFVSGEGELQFEPSQDRAFVPLVLLPKRLGEHSDELQIVIEDADGGATFDPSSDGGAERCVLTITIQNENDDLVRFSAAMRASRWVDKKMNVDSLRLTARSWYDEVVGAVTQVGEDDEPPSKTDWAMHVASVPWKLPVALLVPPESSAGGWPCFVMSLVLIGGLTTWVIDFAELFGCVANIEDSITAITLVALGTSMPDLFASKSAAVQDDWADASIVNVTGSNSVNVFLGIGLPWTMSAVYWAIHGATDEWQVTYPGFVERYPAGAFVVVGGDLAFSVVVFTVAAVVALSLIRFRRVKLGGELGGPYLTKIISAVSMVSLWFFYLGLSIWKIMNKSASLESQAFAIFIALCILENVVLVVGIGLYLTQGRASAPAHDELKDLEATSSEATTFDMELSGGHAQQHQLRSHAAMAAPPPRSATAAASARRPPLGTFGYPSAVAAAGSRWSYPPGLQEAAEAIAKNDPRCAHTVYGMRLDRMMPPAEPVGAMSFCSAAMVCLAVQRFRSTLDRGYSSAGALSHGARDDDEHGGGRRFRSAREFTQPVGRGSVAAPWAAADAGAMAGQPPTITRDSSFHSAEGASSLCSSPRDGEDGEAGAPGAVSAMAGRVAGIVGRNAVDWAALSAAGLAAAQLVDPEGTAVLLGGGVGGGGGM